MKTKILIFILIMLFTYTAYTATVDDVYNLVDDVHYRVNQIQQSVVPSDRGLSRRSFRSPSVLDELSTLKYQVSDIESQLDTLTIFAWIWTIGFVVFIIFKLRLLRRTKNP